MDVEADRLNSPGFSMNLLLIVMLPLVGAVLPALMFRSGRNACTISTVAVNLLSFGLLVTHVPAVMRGEIIQASWNWVPQLGLNVQFWIDGLGLLFAGMILGIGLLVVVYARFYLDKSEPMGNFFTYLLLFQGAMVGIVLSNNLLFMLVYWELTSLSSFLLIGFWSHTVAGRQGARMALAMTGAGGLSLIAAALLIGQTVGSFELTTILASGDLIRSSSLYHWILLLVLGGCFTKSAQFPFHFWLPHAMAAPTPVSAYLHSATMVKAGVFLMARLWPVLSGTESWFYIVATTGLVTMLLGAVIALFQDDLKGLLAYSTISHLGLMTMLLGFSTPMAVVACVFHIINHATFKAALFMNAGIVDHEAGTRDLKRLGGLIGLMPTTATIAMIAAASMGGLPPLNGFLSKEMMLEEASHTAWLSQGWVIPTLVTVASIFSFAYSLRYVAHVFWGKRRSDYPKQPHDPPLGLWFPPTLLIAIVVLIGLFPEMWAGNLVRAATSSVTYGDVPEFHLHLWHGMTPALIMSMVAVGVGALFVLGYPTIRRWWEHQRHPSGKQVFDALIAAVVSAAHGANDRLHNGSLQRFLFLIVTSASLLGAYAYLRVGHTPGNRVLLPVGLVTIAGWGVLMAACVLAAIAHRHRLIALITVNVIGLISSLAFVYLSAPDLALTQISVEVVTLILMLLALYFLPDESKVEATKSHRLRDLLLATAAGLGVGTLAWVTMTRDFATQSAYYVAESKIGGGGANVVNVIIVDFRGFDTFGEIMVLGIAGLTIYALLDGMLVGRMAARLAAWQPGPKKSPERHPLMMVVATRAMLPFAVMVSVFIFLRGHNAPGGGFIAALIVSIALIMQYMASGFRWAAEQVKFNYHGLLGGGALIAAATGVIAMVMDDAFLTSGFDHFHIPLIGDVELATAMLFDAGVFFTVVGGVMLALANLSNLGRCAAIEECEGDAGEFDPSVYHPRREGD